MTAGAICLVSDIPAHRELVDDPSQRFAPSNEDALRAALDRVLQDLSWREAALVRQASVWPRFRAADVAGRFWDSILPRLEMRRAATVCGPAVLSGKRPRVAMLAPLPPDRSGVADYTAATCAELGRLVELHMFSESATRRPLPGASSIRPLSALPHMMPSFDRVISVVGNSHLHARIFDLLLRYGGAAISHDSRMLGFYCLILGRERAIRVASQELRRPVTDQELATWLADERLLEPLFLGEIAASSSPTIVHSPITADLISKRYEKTPVYLPFSIYRPWTAHELTLPARKAAGPP